MLKKLAVALSVFLLAFMITGCNEKNVEGKLEDIMTKLYADIPEDERPMMLTNVSVTNENIERFLGTSDIEYESALASESSVGSIAHSVVLIRAKENANIEEIKTKIKDNVNPRKWLCTGVEDEDVVIENKGDLIVLMLVEDETTRNKLVTAFNNL